MRHLTDYFDLGGMRGLDGGGLRAYFTRTRDGQRRPCHLAPAALEALTAWIDTYRLEAERRFRHLDSLLESMEREKEKEQ